MDKPSGRARRHDLTAQQHRRESSQSRTNSSAHRSRTANHNDHESGGLGSRARQSQTNVLPGGSGFGDVVALSRATSGDKEEAHSKRNSMSRPSVSPSSRYHNDSSGRRDKSRSPPSQLSSSQMETGSSPRAAAAAFTSFSSNDESGDDKYSPRSRTFNSSRQEEKPRGQDTRRMDTNRTPSSRGSPPSSRKTAAEEAKRTQHKSGSKSASNTPKTKRRERSASRHRDSVLSRAHHSVDHPNSSGEVDMATETDFNRRDSAIERSTRARRASIPVIRLSREDSKTHREIPLDDLSGPDPQKRVSSKRRMSAFCHAKLAFEKVAMAVTDTDPVVVTRKQLKEAKSGKDRRARAQSAPRELLLLEPGGRKVPSISPASSRDNDWSEESDRSDVDDEMQRLHVKENVPSPKLKKSEKKKKSQEQITSDRSVHLEDAPPSGRKHSAPFKFFQAITKSSSSSKSNGSSTTITSPPRQPTPNRPRKKFSRGHIDQDPLEVDYEILDDRVTSIKPRPSLPNTHELVNKAVSPSASSSKSTAIEPRSSVPDRIKKSSVEEPLLPKRSETEIKFAALRERQRDQRAQSLPRPSSVSYVPSTFPRTSKQKQIQHPLQDVDVSSHGPAKQEPMDRSSIYTPSERLVSAKSMKPYKGKQDFPSTELSSPEKYSQANNFSSLHKVPSKSSCTSSDAQSDVCLDLPDPGDQQDDDLHLHLRDPELQEHQRDPKQIRVKHSFPSAPYSRIAHYSQKSLLLVFFTSLMMFIVSFLLMWPLLATLLVIVPCVVLLKRLSGMLCCCSGCSGDGRGGISYSCCCVCCCHTHLTSSELVWLGRPGGHAAARSTGRPDRKSTIRSTGGHSSPAVVQSLLVLQRGLDTDRIRRLIDSRLLSVENRHGQKLYPRFTQKVMPFCCGQAWVSVDHMNVSKHVFSMPGHIETLEDLQQYVSKMASEPLPLDAPLWEVQVLHNFREPRDTVLLFRMHQCMTDGVSMISILENAFVDTQKSRPPKQSFSAEAVNISPFRVLFSGPMTFFSRYLCGRKDFNLLHGRHVHESGELVVAWSEPFSLSAALRVKQVARCTLTELLLSIVAGNVRSYMQVSGITNPYGVRCAVPVDFQGLDTGGAVDMETKYSVVMLPLASNIEGVIPRLWETKYQMNRFKSSAEAAIVNGARWMSYCLLPSPLFQRLWKKVYSRCTLTVSNLSGPSSVLKLDSREVKCMMYWVPPLEQVPLTVSFLSYADQLRMAVMSDRSVVPNPDLLTRDFNHKLETLSKLLAHRRIPGESSSSSRHENVHLLSSFTLDDLTADQISLEMSLVQTEVHELKLQLESGPSNQISSGDTQLMARIEALKERWRELLLHLRKRKAAEAESAVILAEEDDTESELGDRHQRPFRRRTLSMSSKMSTASVSSTMRPLSTSSNSNLPSPVHTALPSWPEGDVVYEDREDAVMLNQAHHYNTFTGARRGHRQAESDISSPGSSFDMTRGFLPAL
ncbi:hypothetical protein ElyMa_005450300 [Elysia marginata]|uniref:Diacylglycerol O-acyltransferase n=1 Tax=Elysia marginata TaxID=1093978 RepID=A0AAV4EN96_9GAST|nr:hypothetical protein ElyMa_005450300 [Elysia marginata]